MGMDLGALKPRRINVPAKLFIIGGTINGFANGIFNAVFQLFLTSMGFGSQNLGFLMMMNAISSTILTLPAGIIADRYGKRRILLVGALATTASMIIFFSTMSIHAFAVAFLLIGVGNASAVVFTPLYSGLFDEDDLEKAFGLWGFTNLASLSLGSLVGFVPPMMVGSLGIPDTLAYRVVMLAGGCLFVVQWVFYLQSSWRVPETFSEGFKFNLKSKVVVAKFCFLTLLGSLSGAVFFSLFPYYVNTKFGLGSGALGGLFFLSNLAMVGSKGLAPKISQQLGCLRSITAAVAVSALFYLLIPVAPSFAVLGALYVFRMGTRFVSDPLTSSLFMRSIHEDEKSTANSLRMLTMNGAQVVAPWLGGTTMEKVGLDFPAYLGAALTLVLALSYHLLLRKEAQRIESPAPLQVAA